MFLAGLHLAAAYGYWPCPLICLLMLLHDAGLRQETLPLRQFNSFHLCLLQACLLPPHRVLPLLRSLSRELLWQYLHHLVAGEGSTSGAVHTELALVLIKEAGDPGPQQATPQTAPQPPEEAERDSSAKPGGSQHQQEHSAPAGAAARVRAGAGGGGAADPRQLLQQHLEASSLYDGAAVMDQLRFSTLYQERVILHRKVAPDPVFLSKGLACRWTGTAVVCHCQAPPEVFQMSNLGNCCSVSHPFWGGLQTADIVSLRTSRLKRAWNPLPAAPPATACRLASTRLPSACWPSAWGT